MDLNKAFRDLNRSIAKNSPTILSALAVGGVITTVILAIKATPKAMLVINNEEMDKIIDSEVREIEFVPLTPAEMAEAVWQLYIPTALMGVATIGCIIAANHIHLRRNAALVSLFTITETAAREYQAKVVEKLGEAKEEKIRGEINQKHMDENPAEKATIILTGKGQHLFYDEFSGRYFYSDIEFIRQKANEFNQMLLKCAPEFLPLNDFYYELGLESIKSGRDIGWNAEDCLLEIDTTLAKIRKEDGAPCAILTYRVWPKYYNH